jgi:hypothetical protein
MLYQRVGITNEVPFSDFLFEDVPVPEEAPQPDDAMLALTDESGSPQVLGNGLLEDSNERALTPEDLAQGLEHVQAYEDQQRQEVAAETVDAVMLPEDVTQASPEEVHEFDAVPEVKPA